MGFAVLCLLVLSAPAMSQGRSSKQPKDDVLGSGYLVPKPDLQRDVLQQFLRLFEGGASVRVENWYPDGPDILQYRYFGDGFFGHYWEERIADRKPSDILPFWVTHFMESCKGRFAAASEPPVARGPDMVQSSAWTCAPARAPYEGYITLRRSGAIVGVFVTMQPTNDRSSARNIDRQIRALLLEKMKPGR
jgi:hypothetical protein